MMREVSVNLIITATQSNNSAAWQILQFPAHLGTNTTAPVLFISNRFTYNRCKSITGLMLAILLL